MPKTNVTPCMDNYENVVMRNGLRPYLWNTVVFESLNIMLIFIIIIISSVDTDF